MDTQNVTSDWQGDRKLADCNKYMLEKEINSDVVFSVGKSSTEIKAHKYILSSRSSVFEAMLFGPLAENGTITVPDIEPDVFMCMLEYMYCDKMEITGGNVCALMYAANKYGLKLAVDLCSKFLEQSLNANNACTVLESATFYNAKDLQKKCLEIIFDDADYILQSSYFLQLSPESVEKIISSDSLCSDENTVYEAVIKWAEEECRRKDLDVSDENIRKVLGKLLYMIRFPIMSGGYFADVVAKRSILSNEEKVDLFTFILGSEKTLTDKKMCDVTRSIPKKKRSVRAMSKSPSPDLMAEFLRSRPVSPTHFMQRKRSPHCYREHFGKKW